MVCKAYDRTDPSVVLDRETRTTYVGGTSSEKNMRIKLV